MSEKSPREICPERGGCSVIAGAALAALLIADCTREDVRNNLITLVAPDGMEACRALDVTEIDKLDRDPDAYGFQSPYVEPGNLNRYVPVTSAAFFLNSAAELLGRPIDYRAWDETFVSNGLPPISGSTVFGSTPRMYECKESRGLPLNPESR